MKELSIEEKAKRYDEAIIRGSRLWESDMITRENYEYIFPEVKESENIKIIKAIKYGLDHVFTNNTTVFEVTKEQCLSWLEARGEQKPVISYDALREGIGHFGITQYQIDNWLKKYVVVEKQCEQKPAGKIEPKFKVGDWVVYCNDDVDLITGIEENGYCINNGGYIPFVCENEMRLWDITDAKVGDVLVSESTCGLGTWYCIFKSLDGDESMTVYCYLARDGRFETKKELCFDKDPYNTKPATKEQRDQLEKAMANAGYTFDFDKKELKKIEGTTAWSEEDEDYYDAIISKLEVTQDDALLTDNQMKFLKSLKDRVHPQPKQEWSEEDERLRRKLIELIYAASYCDERENLSDWLKSLKERCNWEPSESDIRILEQVIDGTVNPINYHATLHAILEKLKKLREE